jgi:hypothetical protein
MTLTLTPRAIDKLKTDLERKRQTPAQVFRLLSDASGGFKLRLDLPADDDRVLREDDRPLLVLEPALAERLSDAALDVGREPDEPEWVLVRGRPSG